MSILKKQVPPTIVAIVFIAVIAIVSGYVYHVRIVLNREMLTVQPSGAISSTSNSVATQTPATQIAEKTVSTSTWENFSSFELGYSISYPKDVTIVDTGDPASLTLDFPKTYFSTDMKDDVVVSIYAAPTCEPVAVSSGPVGEVAENIMVRGINFVRNTQDDAAAGNRYHTVTYDAMRNQSCYRITYFVHGANGAGLYVSDPSQMQAMQSTHDAELAYVTKIFSAILSSFTFLDTPPGQNEATHIEASTTPQVQQIYFRTRSQ